MGHTKTRQLTRAELVLLNKARAAVAARRALRKMVTRYNAAEPSLRGTMEDRMSAAYRRDSLASTKLDEQVTTLAAEKLP